MTRVREKSRSGLSLTLCLALASCGPIEKEPLSSSRPDRKGSIVVGMPQVGILDPARSKDGPALSVIRTACDAVMALHPDSGKPYPALAEKVDLAPGARKVTVKLRPDLKFSDGSPVTAESVREGLSRPARPSISSSWALLVARVSGFAEVQSEQATHLSGVRVLNPLNLEVDLSEPFSDFPTVLAHPALTPVSLESLKEDPAGPDQPVCSGPYRIVGSNAEAEVRLEAQENGMTTSKAYRRGGSGFLKEIVVRSYDSAADGYEAFVRKEIQIAPVPADRVADAGSTRGFESRPGFKVAYLAFDSNQPPTSDPRVRQAISLAIDRLVVIDAAFGDQRPPAVRWLPDDFVSGENGESGAGSCKSFIRRLADKDKAKELLSAVGIDPSKTKLSLVFDATRVGGLVAQAIQIQVGEALGIQLEPEKLAPDEFAESVAKRAGPSVWLLNSEPTLPIPDDLLGSVFKTGSPKNLLGFSDPGVDSRIDEARMASDTGRIAGGWLKAESAVCSKMPATPLWRESAQWIRDPSRTEVEGDSLIDLFGGPVLRHVRPV